MSDKTADTKSDVCTCGACPDDAAMDRAEELVRAALESMHGDGLTVAHAASFCLNYCAAILSMARSPGVSDAEVTSFISRRVADVVASAVRPNGVVH